MIILNKVCKSRGFCDYGSSGVLGRCELPPRLEGERRATRLVHFSIGWMVELLTTDTTPDSPIVSGDGRAALHWYSARETLLFPVVAIMLSGMCVLTDLIWCSWTPATRKAVGSWNSMSCFRRQAISALSAQPTSAIFKGGTSASPSLRSEIRRVTRWRSHKADRMCYSSQRRQTQRSKVRSCSKSSPFFLQS